jgi:hypothetical protein
MDKSEKKNISKAKKTMKNTEKSCLICYGKLKKTKISCPSCEEEICFDCVRDFLLQNEKKEAECPLCKKHWTDDFIRNNTPKVFHNKQFREYKSKVDLSIEKSMFPMAMSAVKRERKNRERQKELQELRNERLLLKARLREINDKIRYVEEQSRDYENGNIVAEDEDEVVSYTRPCPVGECKGSLNNHGKCGLCDVKVCLKCENIKEDEHKCNKDDVASVKEKMKGTVPCPSCHSLIFKTSGCFDGETIIPLWNGTTKKAYEISIGDELIGDDGKKRTVINLMNGKDMMYEVIQNKADNYIVNSEHKLLLINGAKNSLCDKGETLEITVKDYLNLSNNLKKKLYGYRINGVNWDKKELTSIKVVLKGIGKYYGWHIDENHRFILSDYTAVRNCSHMFCTKPGCYTSFDWKTRKTIKDSQNTNPHYYAFKAANGGMRRDPLDIPCGGINNNAIVAIFKKYIIPDDPFELCRSIHHNRIIVLPTFQPGNITQNLDITVKFLLNDFDEKKYEQELKKRHKKREKMESLYPLLDMFIQVMTEQLMEIPRVKSRKEFDVVYKNMIEVQAYTNTELKKLSLQFDNSMPVIENFYIIPNKIARRDRY